MSKEIYSIRRKTPPPNAKSPWTEKVCEACGEPFWVIPSAAKNALTCSRECKRRWQASRLETISCRQCGKNKIFYKCEEREFCSEACRYKFNSGSNHARWVKDRIRNCLQCSKGFPIYIVRPSGKESYSERKFCSAGCRKLYREINPYSQDAEVGEVFRCKDGYIYEKVFSRGWIPQHRYVMEQAIGRRLSPLEDVHHRNGDKTSNQLSNLQLLNRSEHQSIHKRAEKLGMAMMMFDNWETLFEGVRSGHAEYSATADSESGTAKWTITVRTAD